MPLVVRRVHPMAIALSVAGALATVGLVALWSSFAGGTPIVAVLVVLLAAWGGAGRAWGATLRLRIDADGIAMPAGAGHVRGRLTVVPWASVGSVALVVAPDGAPLTLAVRLAPGAPLPRTVQGRISDPADPEADDEQLTAKVGDLGLDGARVRAALEAFGGGRPVHERRVERFGVGPAR